MNSFEQPKFEIKPIVEQKPFENPAVRSFFDKWCKINDSIRPKIVTRREWEERGVKGVLERAADGTQTLFIPHDLHLWEMVGVMETIDNDTFATKPEKRMEARDKLIELGKIFQNSGVYIATRLEALKEGQEIAKSLAEEFYEYGQSLVTGKRPERPIKIEEIAEEELTSEETEIIDRFIAGDKLYESRRAKVESQTPDNRLLKELYYEVERQKTLAQFFRVAEKAFQLESKSRNKELQENPRELKAWQKAAPIHTSFLEKIKNTITQKVETPKRELTATILRRGADKLLNEMKEGGWRQAVNKFFKTIGLDIRIEQKKLVDALDIPGLKRELARVRLEGDSEKIARKEREIADKIQRAVAKFPYQPAANNPAEMVVNQYINCVGASMLGGALAKEAGLNYLVGTMPTHSLLLLITSDGGVEIRDMLDPSDKERLSDEMIEGFDENNIPLEITDIVEFSKKPRMRSLKFNFRNSARRKVEVEMLGKQHPPYIIVSTPEHGYQLQLLGNTGTLLAQYGYHEEALEAFRQAIALEPKESTQYYNLGVTFFRLERNEEAIEAFRQAIALEPRESDTYYGLSLALQSLGYSKKAFEAYEKSLMLDIEKETRKT